MIDLKAFLFENGEKFITLKAYIYSFYYRYVVMHTAPKKLEERLGVRGEESPQMESRENLKKGKIRAFHVNRITERLPWNEKCFVRALTLKRLLKEEGIPCTIYLGVNTDKDGLHAHAWLRCGQIYLTGGNGMGQTVVAKFASK